MQKTLQFYECEHDGDLGTYVDDLVQCGATIISTSINEEAEIGTVVIEFPDNEKVQFIEKLRKTETFLFLN